MESKYLDFIKEIVPNRKTPLVHVMNKSTTYLGTICFYPAWRKFVFNPESDIVFDTSCLSDIIAEINELQHEWKESLKNELKR